MDLSHIVRAIAATNQQPIQGLIGQDVMRDQQAIIDFENSVLYLKTVDGLDADIGPCDEDAPQPETGRKSVVEGKSRSVRVDYGGQRIIKKKKNGKRTKTNLHTNTK